MATIQLDARHAPASVSAPAAPRDGSVDLARAFCVAIVVALHAMMVGVAAGPSGISFFDATESADWLIPFSWSVQVMPLFFIIGGFSGFIAYQRLRARGAGSRSFLSSRVRRLLLPALVTIAVVGIVLVALSAFGVPGEFVETARFRFGQPLWFLATFLMCQALFPPLIRAHERAPWTTILSLAGAAVAVDAARALSGIEAIGLLNLAFVWLTIQQLGVFLARGDVDRMPRWARIAALTAATSALLFGVLTGVYSADLLSNLNPPTTLLLLIGIAQLFLFSLLRPALSRLSRRPAAARFTGFVTPRAMTIYLWHMPVLLAMAAGVAILAVTTGNTLAEVSSTAWWLERPLWLGTAFAVSGALAWMLAPVEQRSARGATPSLVRAICATALGLAALVLVLALSSSVFALFLGAALMLLALRALATGRASAMRS